tara:strand:+ start:197 stop:664 length:468 start_codon:yes stop_codon:yes gene_type:complete
MQNYIKSQTRLAFIQFIFQSEFLNLQTVESFIEFKKYFYNSNIAVIGDKKEFKLKFNENFLTKLSENYLKNFDKKSSIYEINNNVNLSRKFDKWNNVLKSIIFAIISELQITDKTKIKIMINDYINIAKSLITSKETKLMNAIIQKYIDEKKNIK